MESTTYSMNWPAVSDKYAVWSKETGPSTGGVEGTNLNTGEIFEVYPQSLQQNAVIPPVIRGNLVSFMNGDIYAAKLTTK